MKWFFMVDTLELGKGLESERMGRRRKKIKRRR